MKCLKSPVNRMGGKFFLTSWITQFIPKHICYVEPFCGAGHLLFEKTPSPVEILNDVDSHLMTFFQVIQEPAKCKTLMERLEFMPYSRALWQETRSRWKAGDIPGDEVERVSWWFYLNRTCFGGDQKRGGFAVPSVTGRNPAQSYFNAIDGLEGIAGRMRGVTIECLDYQECIRRYDSPDTLFYCDPPYLDAGHYYGKDFTQEDHHRLSELLNDAKGKVMITHYQNGLYDELYQGWRRFEYSSFKAGHKSEGESKPKTVECLWTNFEVRKTQKVLFPGVNL